MILWLEHNTERQGVVFLVFGWLIAEPRADIEVIRSIPRAICTTPFQGSPYPPAVFLGGLGGSYFFFTLITRFPNKSFRI